LPAVVVLLPPASFSFQLSLQLWQRGLQNRQDFFALGFLPILNFAYTALSGVSVAANEVMLERSLGVALRVFLQASLFLGPVSLPLITPRHLLSIYSLSARSV